MDISMVKLGWEEIQPPFTVIQEETLDLTTLT
jgi:hypothetical protein